LLAMVWRMNGGLYVPETLPHYIKKKISASWRSLVNQALAFKINVALCLKAIFLLMRLKKMIDDAYASFPNHSSIAPMVQKFGK